MWERGIVKLRKKENIKSRQSNSSQSTLIALNQIWENWERGHLFHYIKNHFIMEKIKAASPLGKRSAVSKFSASYRPWNFHPCFLLGIELLNNTRLPSFPPHLQLQLPEQSARRSCHMNSSGSKATEELPKAELYSLSHPGKNWGSGLEALNCWISSCGRQWGWGNRDKRELGTHTPFSISSA